MEKKKKAARKDLRRFIAKYGDLDEGKKRHKDQPAKIRRNEAGKKKSKS